MVWIPYVVTYFGIGFFIILVVARVLWWRRMPMHLRWELYPVAHEGKRAEYGGSYLEETDWWTKPRQVSLTSEIKAMGMEIVFLIALREHNPKMWLRSFPFHFGLYLLFGCTVLMFGHAIVATLAPQVVIGTAGTALHYGIIGAGFAGLGLGLVGAIGLLHRRLGDPALREFTAPADYFNLGFFITALGVALVHNAAVDVDFSRSMAFVKGLITLSPAPLAGSTVELALTTGTVIILALLVAYIPATHMSHFIGKYFAYHAIRWNDAPNLRGGSQEATINALLAQPVSWSAVHIRGEGRKTWAELASEEIRK